YVWNWTYAPTPEESHLHDLAVSYADLCDAPGFEATNGADWYVTNGDTNDWSYWRYGGMDFTLEVSGQKAPSTENLPTVLEWHRDAILAFLTTPITLRGVVVDAESGAPIHARLALRRDDDRAITLATHVGTGTFARVAEPGRWTLAAEAPGYLPGEIA